MSRQERRRKARAEERGRSRRRRAIAYAISGTAVLLVALWFGVRPFDRYGGDVAPGDVLVVQANMAGFRPAVLRAKVGEPITVQLVSLDTRFHRDGGGRHQFAIDELGVNIVAPPLGTGTASFVVSEPGVYPFYCSICCGGKANPSMWGRLIVEA